MFYALIAALIAAGWLGSAALSYGIMFAYFQRKWPTLADEDYRSDMGGTAGFSLLGGPIALLVSIFFSGFCQYGLKWR